ncbi:unnamed protein product, partial [Arabidopsis halleri]
EICRIQDRTVINENSQKTNLKTTKIEIYTNRNCSLSPKKSKKKKGKKKKEKKK